MPADGESWGPWGDALRGLCGPDGRLRPECFADVVVRFEVGPTDEVDEVGQRGEDAVDSLRASWDGVPYQSYESLVAFDCDKRTARYRTIDYFTQPLWAGKPYRTQDYSQGEPRWMLFREVEPNPNVRIINAACATASR